VQQADGAQREGHLQQVQAAGPAPSTRLCLLAPRLTLAAAAMLLPWERLKCCAALQLP
jgi:hypothetical protein